VLSGREAPGCHRETRHVLHVVSGGLLDCNEVQCGSSFRFSRASDFIEYINALDTIGPPCQRRILGHKY